jgi:iron(III) transport system permease protein
VLPLLRPAFFGGWLFIFLVAFRELSRSLLLHGLDTKVVSVALFNFWDDGQLGELGAFSILLSLALFTFALIARRIIGRSRIVIAD